MPDKRADVQILPHINYGQLGYRHSRMVTTLFIILCLYFCSCTPRKYPYNVEKTYPYDSLNYILYDNLNHKKIVMLGDLIHGHGYYLNEVTSFLRYWIDQSINKPDDVQIPSKLFLFLEMNKEIEQVINTYFTTGDVFPLLSYMVDNNAKFGWNTFTIDYLQFLSDLRDICNEISRVNQGLSRHRLELRIVGPEADPPYSAEDIFKISQQEFQKKKIEWFALVRDRLSSKNIKTALDSNPDYKALIYYGSGHLTRNKRDKTMLISTGEPIYDYFLGHFLDSLFGRNQVSTFVNDIPEDFNKTERDGNSVEQLKHSIESPDFMILKIASPVSPCPIYFIRNNTIQKALLGCIKKYGQCDNELDYALTIYFIRTFHDQFSPSYLYASPVFKAKIDSFYHGCPRDQYKAHVQRILRIVSELVNSFDAIENIERIDEWATLKNLPDPSSFSPMIRNYIQNLPSNPGLKVLPNSSQRGVPSESTLSNYKDEQLLILKKELVQYSLINLLWLATPLEKERAIRALQQSTGLNYATADEWSAWWRSKH